jgi:hypothetical protein
LKYNISVFFVQPFYFMELVIFVFVFFFLYAYHEFV